MLLALVVVLAFSYQQAVADSKVIIKGSTTVNNFVFNGNEEELEKHSGVTFEVFPSSSGRGLIALSENHADIGMISSEIETLIARLEEEGHEVNIDEYDLHKISETRVQFVVHKDNPLQSMTEEQLKDIFLGKITDWGALGVEGLGPIKIVTEHPTGGVYNTIVSKVLDGNPITEDRITMQNGPQVAVVVAQLPGGFGMLSEATPEEQKKTIRIVPTPDINAVQHLCIVTRKGEARDNVLRLVKTIKEYVQ